MKLIPIFLTVVLMNVYSTAYSQKITFSGTNLPLKVIFSAIQKQTGYGFFYSSDILKGSKPVTIKVQNLSLSEVLAYAFKNQGLKYIIENKTILVSKKQITGKIVKSKSVKIRMASTKPVDKKTIINTAQHPLKADVSTNKSNKVMHVTMDSNIGNFRHPGPLSILNSALQALPEAKMNGLIEQNIPLESSNSMNTPSEKEPGMKSSEIRFTPFLKPSTLTYNPSSTELTAKNGSLFKAANVKVHSSLGKQFKPDTNLLTKLNFDTISYRRSFFAELGGNSIAINGNYDRRLKPGRNDGWGFRIGIGIGSLYFNPENYLPNRYIAVPLGLNYIVGKRRSGLETGIGVTTQVAYTPVEYDDPNIMMIGVYNLGYRFQPLGSDLMFRAGWSPIFNRHGFFPGWAGVSIGYSLLNKDNKKMTIPVADRTRIIGLDDEEYKFWKGIAIGARFTKNFYRAAAITNPSPSNIYGPRHSSIDFGVYGLRYFKNNEWGVKMGLEMGLIPWLVGVDSPMDAITTGQQYSWAFGINDFSYKSVTLSTVYKVPLKRQFLEISAGASFRDYAFGNGPDEISWKWNRNTSTYDAEDIEVKIRSLDDQFHISFPVSVDYAFRTGNRSQLKVGIMNNIAVKPLYGDLTTIMYKQTYHGKYSPRTSFWGVNSVFEYNLNKNARDPNKSSTQLSQSAGKFRKALYVENRGSGIYFSGHFDTRLKRDVNDGFGVKVGFGKGQEYHTEITNNNKPTTRSAFTFPVGVNYILGKKRHGLEAGVGITPQVAMDKIRENSRTINSVFFQYHLGYRFQPVKEGVIARIGWAPNFDKGPYQTNFSHIYTNTGISVGYSFK